MGDQRSDPSLDRDWFLVSLRQPEEDSWGTRMTAEHLRLLKRDSDLLFEMALDLVSQHPS